MITGREADIHECAVRWHLASDSDDMDWDGFTTWLEADPSHRQAYDEVALTDAALVDHRLVLQPETKQAELAAMPASRRMPRLAWAGSAIAATLVAVLTVPHFLSAPEQVYQTDGNTRSIALPDGSRVTLAPHSSLKVAGDDQDRMELAGGAMFDVRHVPARALTVVAGDLSIRDIGTRFDVQNESGRVRVAVAEGRVEVGGDPLAQPVGLAAGNALLFDARRKVSRISSVDRADVGSWRAGRLTYNDAPLPLVAADLARYAGAQVVVPDALGDRRFSGTLTIGDGDAAIRDLAEVLDLRLGGRPGAWRLELPDR